MYTARAEIAFRSLEKSHHSLIGFTEDHYNKIVVFLLNYLLGLGLIKR